MCFIVNNIDENMYVEVHKYYLCIKFDIVFKIYQVVLFLPHYGEVKNRA